MLNAISNFAIRQVKYLLAIGRGTTEIAADWGFSLATITEIQRGQLREAPHRQSCRCRRCRMATLEPGWCRRCRLALMLTPEKVRQRREVFNSRLASDPEFVRWVDARWREAQRQHTQQLLFS